MFQFSSISTIKLNSEGLNQLLDL